MLAHETLPGALEPLCMATAEEGVSIVHRVHTTVATAAANAAPAASLALPEEPGLHIISTHQCCTTKWFDHLSFVCNIPIFYRKAGLGYLSWSIARSDWRI